MNHKIGIRFITIAWAEHLLPSGLVIVKKPARRGNKMKPEEEKRIALQKSLGEIAQCSNPETCPHALHRMSVEEYTQRLKQQAERK
jgi:hypothetical protein